MSINNIFLKFLLLIILHFDNNHLYYFFIHFNFLNKILYFITKIQKYRSNIVLNLIILKIFLLYNLSLVNYN